MEIISRLDETQKMYFDRCVIKFKSLLLDEPSIEQQIKLVELISQFNLLDQTQVITPSGKTLNETEKFKLWYSENLNEIIEIFFP